MGRVDEAMRRAAAQGSETRVDLTPDPPAFPSEAFPNETFPDEAAAVEPFPVEAFPDEDSSAQPIEHADEFRDTHADEPVEPEGPDPAAHPPALNGSRPSAIFEHLDARLAGKIVVDQAMKPVFREQYRRLAASLHQAQKEHGLKVIMVVSAVVAEGKTLTAANLALTLSESYNRRVLLIDGDLRRPSLHAVFNLAAGSGLSEGLFAKDDLRIPLHQISPTLALLPAGRPMSDPMAGLTSDRMRRVIDEGKGAFDWVIVDTPPVGLLPDGHLLASLGDGALLVIKAGDTGYKLVQRAIESIGRDRVLGVVLNKADTEAGDAYYYRYDYRSNGNGAAP